jgi:hypothetical protein
MDVEQLIIMNPILGLTKEEKGARFTVHYGR